MEVKNKGAEEPEDRRPRCQSPDKNKNVLTNDTKSFKPEMLEINLPPFQMKDWYQKWEKLPAGQWLGTR